MRIRTIKPEFFTHEALYDLEVETKLPLRVAFAGLWCAADREGRFQWRPRRLKVQILPYDSCDFSRVLDALATRGFVVKYASGNDEFGYIPSFATHQVINNREKESELPNPLECKESDACPTREARVPHATSACTSGREGKGKEGNTICPDSKSSRGQEQITWNGDWLNVTTDDRSGWMTAFPAVDISRQLAAAGEWLKANPAKAKKRNYRRFITNWLARAQERGGDIRSAQAGGKY